MRIEKAMREARRKRRSISSGGENINLKLYSHLTRS
jgi:hypothetical protein